jgi:2-hydroxy-3-keto-5-methylthiopentenyl-1-phosphate phosphatase
MSGQQKRDERGSSAKTSVVLDWDGTVTEVDGLDLVLSAFGDPGIYERVEAELGSTLTLNEVIEAEFATVTAPLEEVVAWLRVRTRVRAGFRDFCERHRPLIVSSGFHELIEPILEREGLLGAVELRANRVDPRPEGWHVRFRDSAVCGACAEPCKRADLPDGFVVFAGDGYSDRCAAVAADRVFATSGLARYLDERGEPSEPFVDFIQLGAALDGAEDQA